MSFTMTMTVQCFEMRMETEVTRLSGTLDKYQETRQLEKWRSSEPSERGHSRAGDSKNEEQKPKPKVFWNIWRRSHRNLRPWEEHSCTQSRLLGMEGVQSQCGTKI
jgi:hypothetical protein